MTTIPTRREMIGLCAVLRDVAGDAAICAASFMPLPQARLQEAQDAILAAYDAQAARIAELEAMLKRLEYAGGAHATEDMCPLCCALLNRPHEPGCELAALLGDGAALRRKEA